MHPHAKVISDFYSAFGQLDAEAMAACYHADIHFSDPAFPNLKGAHASNMWRMLCATAKNFRIEASAIKADDNSGSAHWDAWYDFSKTGRRIENRIDATFTFRDGLIVRHVDSFNMWRWSRMAFGLKGLLLGWTPILPGMVRKRAAEKLADFEASL